MSSPTPEPAGWRRGRRRAAQARSRGERGARPRRAQARSETHPARRGERAQLEAAARQRAGGGRGRARPRLKLSAAGRAQRAAEMEARRGQALALHHADSRSSGARAGQRGGGSYARKPPVVSPSCACSAASRCSVRAARRASPSARPTAGSLPALYRARRATPAPSCALARRLRPRRLPGAASGGIAGAAAPARRQRPAGPLHCAPASGHLAACSPALATAAPPSAVRHATPRLRATGGGNAAAEALRAPRAFHAVPPRALFPSSGAGAPGAPHRRGRAARAAAVAAEQRIRGMLGRQHLARRGAAAGGCACPGAAARRARALAPERGAPAGASPPPRRRHRSCHCCRPAVAQRDAGADTAAGVTIPWV